MGHTGWGETGNPTHCISFQWNNTKGAVDMNYKINEADVQWRPTMKFDSISKLWVKVPDFSYQIMSLESTALLLGKIPSVVSQDEYAESLRTSVLSCGSFMEGLEVMHCGSL